MKTYQLSASEIIKKIANKELTARQVAGDIPFDGAAGLVSSVLTMGPMGRYVEDVVLAMEVISGEDVLDPYAPPIKFKRSALPLNLSAIKNCIL